MWFLQTQWWPNIILGKDMSRHELCKGFTLYPLKNTLKCYLFMWLHWSYLQLGSFSFGVWNLVPCPGIEPRALALGAQHLSHWTTREVSRFAPYKTFQITLLPPSFFSPDQLSIHTDLSFYFWSWCNTMPWEFFNLGACKMPGDTTKKWREVSFPADGSWPLESGRWERELTRYDPFLSSPCRPTLSCGLSCGLSEKTVKQTV